MKSNSKSNSRKYRRGVPWSIYLLIGITLGTGAGVYLWNLYSNLTTAFSFQDPFVPTRIYSDVTQILPGQLREQVLEHLKTRGYNAVSSGSILKFTLHSIDYPLYLIPDNHPMVEKTSEGVGDKGIPVTLHFEKREKHSVLREIELGDKSVPDIFLEPELVATLSRNGSNATQSRREIRTFLKFEEIPANVWKAIIAIEDQHFLEHNGLDPRGIVRALWVNFKTLSLAQGGSTITQQLVKNLMARHSKNLIRKFNELLLSLLLEAKFTKEQILERYLNEVYLGQVGNLEVHGVAEGAEHFFGKKLTDLNLGEVALMAGLIRGPGYYSPYKYKSRAIERQKLVLKKMVETGEIAEAEAIAALKQPIRLAPLQTAAVKAPFFTDYVKAELIQLLRNKMKEQEITEAGFRVYTTLDVHLNTLAQKAVASGVSDLEKRFKYPPNQRLEGALACVDHTTGYIRALIGGRDYSQSNFNRILNMKRQVGSTFKPLIYLTAFQQGEDPNGIPYGPAHPAQDAPWTLTFDHGKQTWSPRNYEKEYLGWVSFRTALSHSINTVSAKLGNEIGIQNIVETGRALGIESSLPAVPSLTLGVAELSPLELLKVYSVLANHGVQDNLTVIRGITQADGKGYARFVYQPKQVFGAGPIDLTTHLLQSVFTEGTAQSAKALGFNRPAAGKTGTTSNYRDAWFAGYTPQLTTVVWVGMDQASSSQQQSGFKPGLTGANSALPIWSHFMSQAHRGLPIVEFPASPLLIDVAIDRHSGKAAESGCPQSQVVVEKYIRGHEPRAKACEPNWPIQK